MVVLNWLILLAVAEKLSHNLLSLKSDFVWFPTLGDDSKNISGEGTYTVLSIYEGSILIEDLVGAKTLSNKHPLLHTIGHFQNNAVWWNCFSRKLIGYQSPLVFMFYQIVGLPSFSDMVCV